MNLDEGTLARLEAHRERHMAAPDNPFFERDYFEALRGEALALIAAARRHLVLSEMVREILDDLDAQDRVAAQYPGVGVAVVSKRWRGIARAALGTREAGK